MNWYHPVRFSRRSEWNDLLLNVLVADCMCILAMSKSERVETTRVTKIN